MDIARDVRTVRFLPAYFSAISHLLALLTQDEPSIPQIVQAVGADQSLTSRLLNVVNSPVYGAVRQIGSIEDAVVRLGLVGLRNLTLAVSMNDISGGMRREEWKHSLTMAFIADDLARKVKAELEVQRFAFVTGLLHDIGKLFLSRRYMLEYQSVYAKIRKGLTLAEAEKSVFGFDHAAVGGMLLFAWNVPIDIVEGVKQHHEPGENKLAEIIFCSNLILKWGEQPQEKRQPIELMGLQQTEVEMVYSDAVAKSRDMETRLH